MNLEGKISLITGGTRGIGAATAINLAGRGADIAIIGREIGPDAMQVKAQIETLGRRCLTLAGDMSKPEDIARCVQETIDALGGIDVLVHSAGGPAPGSLLDIAPEAWYYAFDIHVHAIFHLCRAVVPQMKTRGEGAIILIASVAGLRGFPGAIAYTVVKGALFQFTRSLARELADCNIRVNCVAPGIIRTRFHEKMTPEQYRHNIENRIPLHREGKPEDVAEAIAMLAVNEFITGESVVIDGGMTMRMV